MFKLSNKIKILLPILIGLLLLIGFTTNISYQNSTIPEVSPETENDYVPTWEEVKAKYSEEVIYEPKYVKVKYREDLIDIGHPRFEYLDTSNSSFVRGALYDKENSYLVIKLKETYYHYCGLPLEIWKKFKKADSFGSYYLNYIKGYYDCRINYAPEY